ncbi:MAG: hypothetical protein EWM50_02890 [Gottschalkiaceae bacterium]|nr:MAG: hypothetical protein EWM50_02890 [Gottschalkiaceae bacterium]
MLMNLNIDEKTYEKMLMTGVDKTQAALRDFMVNNSGEKVAFVIQTREGKILQLTKDETKAYITGGRGVSGLTKTKDNRLPVNNRELPAFDLIRMTPDNVMVSRNEFIRSTNEWLIEHKYKGFKSSGKVSYKVNIGINGDGEVALCVQHLMSIGSTKIDKYQYFSSYKHFVPACYKNDMTQDFKIAVNPKNTKQIKLLYTLPIRIDNSGYLTRRQVAEIERLIGLE